MPLSDYPKGLRVWTRKYKTHGTVDRVGRVNVFVKLDNTGEIRPLPPGDLENIRESRAQTEFRTTRKFTHTPQVAVRISKRARVRSGGYSDISRMFLSDH